MTPIKYWLLVVMMLCVSCWGNENTSTPETARSFDKVEKNLTFAEYVNEIKPITLPLKLVCDKKLNGPSQNMSQESISTYGHGNPGVYGKLADTEKYTAIMYIYPADIVLPKIVTTDKKGNKISELSVYEKWCGEEEFSDGLSWVEISKDLVITLSDSVNVFKRDEKGIIVESSRKKESRSRVCYIDEDGKIRKKDK